MKRCFCLPSSSLLAPGEGRVLSHTLLRLASFRTFQLSNLPLHKIFYGHSCLTFQFPEQVHPDLFSQGREDEIQQLSLEAFLASCEESEWKDQPNQELQPPMRPNSEPYSHEYVMGIQSCVLASSHLAGRGYVQGC